MGPNPNGPTDQVSCDRAIRYSGFFGVRETWVLLEISGNPLIKGNTYGIACFPTKHIPSGKRSHSDSWKITPFSIGNTIHSASYGPLDPGVGQLQIYGHELPLFLETAKWMILGT